MKICMIGSGYVGLVSGVCFSDLGNSVYCVDKDKDKINFLNKGKIRPQKVADIGCGTGILAISAYKVFKTKTAREHEL